MKVLFNNWAKKMEGNNYLIEDGIIDEEEYKRQTLRVLYVLKESYESEDENGHIRKSILADDGWIGKYLNNNLGKNSDGKMLTKLTKMQYMIEHPDEDLDKIKVMKIDKNILRHIAFININKHGNGKRKCNTDLKQIIDQDCELLQEQIKIINPNVVIFGCNKLLHYFMQKTNFDKKIIFIETYHFSVLGYENFHNSIKHNLSNMDCD